MDLFKKIRSLENEVSKFYSVGKELSAEKNINKLLDLIVTNSMELTQADAATIYIIEDGNNEWSYYDKDSDKQLKFAIAKNKSIELKLQSALSPITKDSIFGYTVITGEVLRIDDAYNIPEGKVYNFNSKYDTVTGYKTKSILTVPMKNHQNHIIGVIQLINKTDEADKILPFNSKDELIITSFAGQAAVAIENTILHHKMERLLEQERITLNEAQAQLIHKEKMAGIGQLAAGIAHEINNPLGFVMSNYATLQKYVNKFKELLLKYENLINMYPNLDDDHKNIIIKDIVDYEKKNNIDFLLDDIVELFDDTNEGLERVANIIDALRSFSHIDQLSQFSEYDLNSGIKTTLTIVHNKIKYSAEVIEELGDIPAIIALGGEINQVFLNIIVNSVYAINEKGTAEGIIKIRTFEKENYIFCEIEDNGVGMSKEITNRIFEPFFTTKPVGDGTGLGLSISYDIIVNKHKGNIYVESEKGVGTKFTIMLPISFC